MLNTSLPDLTSKKNKNGISYHAVRCTAVANELWVYFEKVNDNMSDILTKNLNKINHAFRSRFIMW